MLIHLPREDGYGTIPSTKNGPALAGYGAVTMENALASTMTTLPEQLRRSLTLDRGEELSQHAAFKVETGMWSAFLTPRLDEPDEFGCGDPEDRLKEGRARLGGLEHPRRARPIEPTANEKPVRLGPGTLSGQDGVGRGLRSAS